MNNNKVFLEIGRIFLKLIKKRLCTIGGNVKIGKAEDFV